MRNILKGIVYLLIPLIVILILSISYLAIDYEARKYVLLRLAPGFNLYHQMIMKESVQERNFVDIKNSLESYLDKSKILSPGKSKMLEGVVDVVDYAAESASSEEELLILEPIFRELIELDPNLYKARIWLARSVINTKPDEALLHIKEAIRISESTELAYRELINLSQKNQLFEKNIICDDFFKAKFGEILPKRRKSFFGGIGLSNFALEFSSKEDKLTLYPSADININTDSIYEFIPLAPITSNGFNLHFSTLPGLSISIDQINIFDISGKHEIEPSDFAISSKYGYLSSEDNGQVTIISLPQELQDEQIYFRSPSVFEDLVKLELKMSIKRLPLTNQKFCQ